MTREEAKQTFDSFGKTFTLDEARKDTHILIDKIYDDFESRDRILSVIKSIKSSFHGSETVYTNGSCYHFYNILKSIFPYAEAFYVDRHIVTKIGSFYYDINGEVKADGAVSIDKADENVIKSIKGNKFGISGYYECPHCGEFIKIN